MIIDFTPSLFVIRTQTGYCTRGIKIYNHVAERQTF